MYVETSPGPTLARAVECCWTMTSADAIEHAVRPDGCLDIVYSRELGLRAVGAMTVEARFAMAAGSQTIGLRFRPGMARPFLRVPPPELTGKIVPLEDLWGAQARQLERRLEDGLEPRIVAQALIAPPAPDPVKRAIEAIIDARGVIDVEWAAGQAGMSPRQFRRRCFEESGLAPKHLCRILRFRHASSLAVARYGAWAEIAADAGYFDQAHLIRDFREFTGRSPMSVFSNTAPAASIHNRA
jgi:AraC-like DNA-binding protein